MTEPAFDHDRLDVYRLSSEYVMFSCRIVKSIVSMLTRLIERTETVSERPVEYEYE